MIDISIFTYCFSILDNGIYRYLFSIPVHLVASTTHLPTFCENYTGISKTYWIEQNDKCFTLFTNIIHFHTIYLCILVVLICCCFRFLQNLIINLLIKTHLMKANKINTAATPNNAAIKARETRLKNTFNEKYSSLLNRLFRALERTKLSITIQNLVHPFQEEYKDLNSEFEAQSGRFRNIQNEN